MKTHAIHWKCRISGSTGIGRILLSPENAERLAEELNENFPDIDHEAKVPERAKIRAAQARR